jgi:hypothetical protein
MLMIADTPVSGYLPGSKSRSILNVEQISFAIAAAQLSRRVSE